MRSLQLSFHDSRPTAHYSEGCLWLRCDDGDTSAAFFLNRGATGAQHARELAAALIACADEAEAALAHEAAAVGPVMEVA